MKKSLRVKLLLLLVLLGSVMGANMGTKASACVGCAVLFSGGHVVGYGCSSIGNASSCTATQSGCSQSGFCF
jgi:hypothetical protein